jgi:prepilin-type N-terminal cleavage/methylation domain-containing protein/prepilin-type processing-associated H-X9-DG protein
MTSRYPRGFTLAELMVVIAIIALLVVMLMPTLSSVYSVVRLTQCSNNLRNIRVAVAALGARDKISRTGALGVEGWRAQLTTYDSNSTEVMICPEGYTLAANWEKDDVLGKYALKTLNGANFLYNMPLIPGPACRKENVTNGGLKYDLSFEDQRTGTGAASGDLSYNNPALTIELIGSDAKITVRGGGGGYIWHLVDMDDKVYLNNILKGAGAMAGDSVLIKGAVSLGGKFSYGLNSVVNDISPTDTRILALDYPAEIARIAGAEPETHDNWMTWVGPNGLYTFARHKSRCNVAMVDGSVVQMYPKDIDPKIPAQLDKYWKP